MNETKNHMKPLEYTYKEKTIYIYKEVFDGEPYALVSYTNDRRGMFKISKSEL